MREHGVRYGDAKRLVLASRQVLKLSRIAPWNDALKEECERRLQANPEQYHVIKTPAMVRANSVKNVVLQAEEQDEGEETAAKDEPKEESVKECTAQISVPAVLVERVQSSQSVVSETMISEEEGAPAPVEKEEKEKDDATSIVLTSEDGAPNPAVEKEEKVEAEPASAEHDLLPAGTASNTEEATPAPAPQSESKSNALDEWLDTILVATSETVQETDHVADSTSANEDALITITKATQETADPTEGETEEETDSQREDDGDKLFEQSSSSPQASDHAVGDEQQTTRPEFDDALDVSERTDCALDNSERTEYVPATEYVLYGSEQGASFPLVEYSERAEADDDDVAKTVAEWIADDCSQATDKSKCFTTAEELEEDGINVAPGRFAQGEEEFFEDDHDHCGTIANTVKRTDEISIDNTAMMSVDTIPSIIYIKSGPPEVPDDEPLVQSFNLPITEREYYVPKKSVMRSLRRKIVRFGIFGRKNASRLSDNDTEVHMQTLVDL